MKVFDMLAEMGHEEIVLCSDPSCGYRGIIAVHSTRLGPALGGTRFWTYATDEEAIVDALRLSRGMTWITSPERPLSRPVSTITLSPFLIFAAITAPPARAR